MKKRIVIGGILSGLLCAVCVFAYTYMVYQDADRARQEAIDRYGGEQVQVLVATRDIYPGETLDSSNTVLKLWVSDLLPDGCITDSKNAWGKQLTSFVIKGEVVSEQRFKTNSVDLDVPEGLVAVSVPAKEVQTVGGMLQPGNLVDVYATGTTTTRLGSNILVLATNASDEEQGAKKSVSWVTLALDPAKTQDFVSAAQSMDLYFALPSADKEAEGGNHDE